MKIIVFAPSLEEYKLAKVQFSCTDRKHQYKVVWGGVGKVNSASSAAPEIYGSQYDHAVLIGCAAGTNKKFSKGDIVIPTYASYHDVVGNLENDMNSTFELDGVDSVRVLTGDTFVTKLIAEDLISIYGEDIIFDMESAALAQICKDSNTSLTVVKVISGIPELGEGFKEYQDFVKTELNFEPVIAYLETLL